MKATLFVLIFAMTFGFFSAAHASQIVLTAFEPFGGVAVNNSAEVVKRLSALLTETAPAGKVQVKSCILPVEYDRAAKVALDCIGKEKPNLVLSFGAGGCEIDFETRGHNRDNTKSPDNAGVLRNQNTPIVKDAPEYVAFNAPMEAIFKNTPRLGKATLARSESAGGYVCNNTAYHLAHTFVTPKSKTRYGFIHVPPVTCGAEMANPDLVAKSILAGLRKAMPALF